MAGGARGDISHEGLRVLLGEEGVSFQRLETRKASTDPGYAVKGLALSICMRSPTERPAAPPEAPDRRGLCPHRRRAAPSPYTLIGHIKPRGTCGRFLEFRCYAPSTQPDQDSDCLRHLELTPAHRGVGHECR